jgi:Integrase core domain
MTLAAFRHAPPLRSIFSRRRSGNRRTYARMARASFSGRRARTRPQRQTIKSTLAMREPIHTGRSARHGVNPLTNAPTVMRQLPLWFEHYNTVHPHRALGYRSPREFIISRNRWGGGRVRDLGGYHTATLAFLKSRFLLAHSTCPPKRRPAETFAGLREGDAPGIRRRNRITPRSDYMASRHYKIVSDMKDVT